MNNPYTTPQNPAYDHTTEKPDLHSLPILKNLVTSWEKTRIIYNLTLAIPGIIVLIQAIQHNYLPTSELITLTIFFALGANAFFFAGPLAELYLCAISQRPPRKKLRTALIIAGFSFSVILILAIGLILLPLHNQLSYF